MNAQIPAEYQDLYLLKKLIHRSQITYHAYRSATTLNALGTLQKMHDEELERVRNGGTKKSNIINFALFQTAQVVHG